MADFDKAFDRTFENEGGMKVTNIKGDNGGQTCCGISRKFHPSWPGWAYVDRGTNPPMFLVRVFYRENFWNLVKGDQVNSQQLAFSLFDMAVNMGEKPTIRLMQLSLGLKDDGLFGPKTLAAINGADAEQTLMKFTLAVIARYRAICMKDRSQAKFLLGWINRALSLLEGDDHE